MQLDAFKVSSGNEHVVALMHFLEAEGADEVTSSSFLRVFTTVPGSAHNVEEAIGCVFLLGPAP